MAVTLHLQCSGPEGRNNGCPEGHAGFTEYCTDSHAEVKEAWARLVAAAEKGGWIRGKRDLRLRCKACDACGPGAIAGYQMDVWDRAIALFVSGQPAGEWGGKDGLPTAQQWHNALHSYPMLKERAKASPIWRGDAGPRADQVSAEMWEKVIERIRAGETREQISTGVDGWPTTRQWDGKRNRDKAFRELLDGRRAEVKAAWDAEVETVLQRFLAGERIMNIVGDNLALHQRWGKRLKEDADFRRIVYEQHLKNGDAAWMRAHGSEMHYENALDWLRHGGTLGTMPGMPQTVSKQSFSRRVGEDPAFAARYNAVLEQTGRHRKEALDLSLDWDGAVEYITGGGTLAAALREPNRPTMNQWYYRVKAEEHFRALVGDAVDARAAIKDQAKAEKWSEAQERKALAKAERAEKKRKRDAEKERRKQERFIPLGAALKQSLNQNEIYHAVNKAVSFGIPAHIRDDVIGSMILAVLEGDLALDQVKARAREFSAAYHREAGTYKTISIDAPVHGTDDLRLIDTIADDTPHF